MVSMQSDGLRVEPALWEDVAVLDANIYEYSLQHAKIDGRILRKY